MAKRALSDSERDAVRELRQKGITNKEIAKQFGVSEHTIIRICRPDLYEKNLASNREYQAKNAQQIYKTRKANSKTYKLELHKVNDANIIEHLDKKENVQGYIRSLILTDMNNPE